MGTLWNRAAIFSIAVIVLTLWCGFFAWLGIKASAQKSAPPAATAIQQTPVTPATTMKTRSSLPETAGDWKEIHHMLLAILGDDAENFSIYLWRPQKEKQPFMYRAHAMRPASMVKVFVMAKAMQDVKDGKFSLDDMVELREEDMVDGAGILSENEEGTMWTWRKIMELMITESDNTATNILIDKIGMDDLNQYLEEQNYIDTEINHKMMIYNQGYMNLSSVRDLGLFFARIYGNICVNEYYDQMMTDFLLGQTDGECFPAALPDWKIAHKTGEIDLLYDDGGIFYGKEGDFILVIMNDDYSARDETIEKMQNIAKKIAAEFM